MDRKVKYVKSQSNEGHIPQSTIYQTNYFRYLLVKTNLDIPGDKLNYTWKFRKGFIYCSSLQFSEWRNS